MKYRGDTVNPYTPLPVKAYLFRREEKQGREDAWIFALSWYKSKEKVSLLRAIQGITYYNLILSDMPFMGCLRF